MQGEPLDRVVQPLPRLDAMLGEVERVEFHLATIFGEQHYLAALAPDRLVE
jgi:hypothetical protein